MSLVTLVIFSLNIMGCATFLLEAASNCELREGGENCTILENACDGYFCKWRNDGEIRCSCCDETEEAGLIICPDDLNLCHVMYRKASDERVSFLFSPTMWKGEPQNMEPNKCSDLSWFNLNSLPENMVPYVRAAIGSALRNELYSEFGW